MPKSSMAPKPGMVEVDAIAASSKPREQNIAHFIDDLAIELVFIPWLSYIYIYSIIVKLVFIPCLFHITGGCVYVYIYTDEVRSLYKYPSHPIYKCLVISHYN